MRQKIIFIFVMAVCTSFLSSTVYAEGWVLWNQKEETRINTSKNAYWKIIDAFPGYEQCMQEIEKAWRVTKDQAIEGKKKLDTISEIKEVQNKSVTAILKEPKEIMSITETYYCLPGTLDPREKK